MFEISELTRLSSWCATRSVAWHPLLQGEQTAVLLEPRGSRRCWRRTLLTRLGDDIELTTQAGELLACASELESVLDALDGGVAEPDTALARPRGAPLVGELVF